ncbi:MAG: prepilin-type N-terminal cleavage/methylation domain-containing protein [Candidatus Omnitrophica bacterium]|nr:prepilin-type N-terminal cleavage/methylation domain-containing protein [Candidatus Omnitrophota bacterium]
MKRKQEGFTLLELMIVIVILGILASIAIPAYTKTVERAKQGEALHWLGMVRESEVRYYQMQGAYTGAFADLDIDAPPTSTSGPNYFIYAAATSASGFTVTATRQAYRRPTGVSPTNYTISIDQAGTINRAY